MNSPHFNQQSSLTANLHRPRLTVGQKWFNALLTSLAAVLLLHAPDTTGQESSFAVTAVSPANSATTVPVGAVVTATFNSAIDPLTVNSSTFELLDPANAVVPATVTCDTNTFTATLTPLSALLYSTTYTATLRGGGSGVKGSAGNPLAADYAWSFTTAQAPPPEPAGWYAGDMHVHRSCGGSPVDLSTIYGAMLAQNVSLVSLLADMGNGEVQNPVTDLPKVNGRDDPISTQSQVIHWEAEWHWDATYSQYAHQALGGHLVNLGLTSAQQIWQEYTYPIINWAHQQGGISGFCHMQYLDDNIPTSLTCCTPIEYPVEVALGTADFIAEDVGGGDTAINAYYRLLNCGFRPGLAAGSDYPCGQVIGPMLTYGQATGGQLTYLGWIDAIARGRTVVSRVGHTQFLRLQVNGTATPGDEIRLAGPGDVQASVQWTVTQSLARTIELVCDGVVVASKDAQAAPGAPDTLTAAVTFTNSGWLCARVMGNNGHEVHTAAIFVIVNGAPVRASVDDANFYVQWMDNLLTNTSPGGVWNSYFPTTLAAAQARYQAAQTVYQQIAAGLDVAPTTVTLLPTNAAVTAPINSSVTATFSEAVDASTVSGSTFVLTDPVGNPVTTSVTYDAGRRRATLSPSSLLAYSTTYTAALKGGSNGIKDPAGTALAADSVWSFTTAALTLPTVSSTSPSSGSSGVAPSTTVGATFSGALNPSTVSSSTFELVDGSNNLVPATVTYDNSSDSATLTPSTPLLAGTYTATIKGGANGITDFAGNAMAADYAWSFTVANYNCPCRIFQLSDTPQILNVNDNKSIELGMRFRSSVDGYITGVRFYKGNLDTGAHTGQLWSTNGTMLAEVAFSGETPSGWQEADFSSPVAITAGTTYIVSYLSSGGFYTVTDNYFAQGTVNGPLQGLADGEDGPNGLYLYTTSSAFPTQTYQSDNYWVDVVFATVIGPDTTPPTVVSTSPIGGAQAVATGASVIARFSEAIDPTTVNSTTFELRDSSNALVSATVSYSPGTLTATLTPSAPLAYDSIYTPVLTGGANGIKDLAGNALAVDNVWAFTTAMPPLPPATEGPGGPILVISAAENPFSRYFAEILRAEGLNEFTAMDISLVTNITVLNNYDAVILGNMPLTAAQVSMLTDWVNAGGNLIAMRPDKQLAGLLGLTDAAGTLSNAYLRIYGTGAGAGIVTNSIQFHGVADRYTLNGAIALASLYSSATNDLSQPAVTVRSVGSSGGHAAAFTFDLGRSVIYTRQGNPAWAGEKRDGQIPPTRSDDQYYGNASFDPEPDWVDLNKVAIPQADEQQRLLANMILQMDLGRKPLPRFWYFPRGFKAVVVMTGDQHGCCDATMSRFQQYVAESPTNGSVADWDCVRASSYVYATSAMTDAQAKSWTDQGFELGYHITTGCADWTSNSLESFFSDQLAAFGSLYPSIPGPVSSRTHCIAWSDWATQPKIELEHGIRLDVNYYYWPQAWIQDRPGFFTGSGMPMRFADLDGTMIDCYQAATQMTDESGQSYPFTINSLLDGAVGPNGFYGVFTCNFHTDNPAPYPPSDETVAAAQTRGVPVVSGRQMLEWLDGRNNSSFGSINWRGDVLGFTVVAAPGSRNIQAMVPSTSAVGAISGITCGGNPVAYTRQTIKGIEYAFFPATNGTYAVSYAPDTTAPVISAVTATAGVGGVATITWTTDEPSDSQVVYGTDSNSLALTASDTSLVTAHRITLTGLSAASTYYFRVTSTDAASNSATAPVSPAPPASFNTPSAAFVDTTAADFGAGAPGTCVTVAQTGNGEVILAPAFNEDFPGTTLSSAWTSGTWNSSGTATVGGGALTVNGAHAASTASFGPGGAIDFVATFQADPFQNVGFTSDFAFDPPWVTFGTSTTGNGVYARASDGTDILISAGLLGAPHHYRIVWNPGNFVFYVDGVQVATVNIVVGANMLAAISDYPADASSLRVDWLRITPYSTSCTFVSRVFNAGAPANWSTLSWSAQSPAGTSLDLNYRIGNTPTPDNSWTTFTPVNASGGALTGNSRYLQYEAQLATTDATQTPELDDVSIFYSTEPDTTPPVISAVSPAVGSGGTAATITWMTDGPANSQVEYGTDPNTLTLTASDASLVTSHNLSLTGLTPNTTYYFRVTSADAANNSGTSPASPAPPASFFTTDTTPPVISTVSATVGAGNTATITWTTDKPSDSGVNYGTDSNTLALTASNPSLVTSHTVTLTGLASATTYYFRVTSTDAYDNGATSPSSPAPPASFASARTTPPVISAVTAVATAGGMATITWATDEAANSRIDYGSSSNSLTLSASNGSLVISHSIGLTGLASATTYYFRVTSTDTANNSATSPATPAPPANFSTPSAVFVDTTVADFSAGAPGSSTYIAQTADGEVILNPTAGAEFYGSTLPAGWVTTNWASGGSATVSGGSLAVDGAAAETTASYGPGRSLEFVATINAAVNQHIGFVSDLPFDPPWAIFSTKTSTNSLYARTSLAGNSSQTDTLIPGNWIGSPHRYRIDWTTTNVIFSIDGVPMITNAAAISGSMSPAASDLTAGGPNLSVDWMRMSSYAASGTFVSRVFDGGAAANWSALTWTSQAPTGTTLALSYRIGNTPTPDASWTAFIPVATSGSALSGNARYFQYGAQLATLDPTQSPVLNDVTIGYNLNSDVTPPTIISLSPAAGTTDVPTNSTVTVSFSEPMNTATLSTTTFRLRLVGGSTDIAAAVSSSGGTATLTPNSPLLPGQSYQVTVAGSITDLSGNPLGSDMVWTFSTAPVLASQTDTTVADFSAGSPGACTLVISQIGNGEVILAPTLNQDFSGTTLPSGWTSSTWAGGGTVAVTGGMMNIDGAMAQTATTYGPGSSLEFVATFGAATSQHAGFATDSSFSSYAMFSTASSTTTLYARASGKSDIAISGSWLGSPHHYLITWTASNIVYWIDGTQVASQVAAISANLRPMGSDFSVGGPKLSVDWMRMTPYITPCSFSSRVIDAGQSVTWYKMAWTALTPTGTTLAMSYRTGNTSTPDGSWSALTPVSTSGGALAGSSRYIQYAAQLATSNTTQTPVLQDVTLTYILCSPPVISSNPSSTTNCVGDLVTFSVTATGTGMTYQWQKNGTNIDGALGSSYTIASVTPGDAGVYDVVVSGPCGLPATSNPASLTINTAPTIICPANIVVPAAPNQCSASVTFAATATGSPTPAITYQIGSTTTASPYLFPVGTTTVNCTAANACGIASCSFTVTVTNATPPELSLTAPAGVSADTNCQAVMPAVTYQVNDHCDTSPTVTQTPTAGTFVGEGTTTITVVATDASGNATTRTTTFTVSDTTAPLITWSFTNLVLQTTSDSCQTNMPDVTGTNYIIAFDSCSGTNLVISQSPTNGAALPEGTNWVVMAVADQAGNTNYSTNSIVVMDATPPSAIMPSDIVQANDPGQCGAVVNFTLPDQTDNCGVPSQVATPASGSFFDVGTTPVTVVVTDLHGNSSSNSFRVTVNDAQAPVIVTNPITVTLDASGRYTMTNTDVAALVAGSHDNCGIVSTNVSRVSFDCNDVGTQTVQVTLVDVHGISSITDATIVVRNLTPPVVMVNPLTVTLDASGNYTLTPSEIAALVAGSSDNCGIANTNVSQTSFTFCDVGATMVQVSLTDVHGNAANANAIVNVQAPASPPTAVYVDASYGTNCGAVTFPDSNSTGTYYVGYNAFGTIQNGIKALIAGGTVNVAAGTYTESGQIHVTTNLNIVGADEATTFIRKDFDTSNSGDTKGWWLVDPGVHFSLSNVTLDGTGHLVFQGVRSYGFTVMNRVHFTNLQYHASGPDYDGRGVISLDNGTMAASLNLTNCQFEAIGRIGVQYFGNCSGNVVNCTYTGKGAGDWLDYGFETGAGAVATIASCVVTNCLGVASVDGSGSAAIQPSTYFGDGTVTYVYNCVLKGNSYGIGIGVDSSDTSVVVARYNDLSEDSVQGIDTVSATVMADAVSNWWGSVTGPTTAANPGGTGVGVSTNVDYSPWLGEGADTNPAIGFQPDLTQVHYPPDHLVFSTEPDGAGIAQPLSPQPVVQVIDSNGGLDTVIDGSVTIAIANNPSGGVIHGTLTEPIIAGAATFSDLSIDKAGAGYTLTAGSTPSINSATSSGFNIANPLPAITTIVPTWTMAGEPAFTLTVNGANFVGNSVIRWNGADRVTTNISPTQLTADITAADIAGAGTASVTVFNPAPGGGESTPATFDIYALPAVVYVNPAFTNGGSNDNHLWGYDAFDTIQTGVNAVAAGGVVKVAAGTYAEVVVVNKPLSLLGAQAGQNANTRFAAFATGASGPQADPAAESILTAAATGPTNAANDTLHIMADNVTVDGFVLDGNNPALLQGDAVIVGGINTDVRRAMETEDAAGNFFPANNVFIKNNIIQNFAQRGIELANPSDTAPSTSGSLIMGNLIRNFGMDGILLAYNAYSDVVSNTVDMAPGAEAGIWLQDFPNNGASSRTLDWSHNTVTVCQDAFGGIWANLFYATAATLNIHDNIVNAAAAVTGDDDYTYGIYLSSLQGGTTACLSNNMVGSTGGQFARGIALWNVPTTTKTTVTGGTVGHALKGVSLQYNDPNFGTAGASYAVDLSAVNVAGTEVGVWVESLNSGSDNVQMQISGNTATTSCNTGISVLGGNAAANIHDNTASITGNGIGISVDAGKVFIENNDLTGNLVAGILATNGAVVDAGNCGADVTGFGTSSGGNNLSGYLTGSAKAIINANAGGLPEVLANRDNFGATSPADNLAAAFRGAVEYSQDPAVFSCPSAVTVTCIGDVPAGAESLADLIAHGGYYSASAATVSYSDTPHPASSGTITRTYTVADACGTISTCTQVITISDTALPTIEALPNLSFSADPGECSRQNVTWTVNAQDNCTLASVLSLPPSGSTFNLGTTIVTNTATDTSSNTTVTTFTVTVTNATPPELSLTAPAGVSADTNCQAVVPAVAYQVSDNCDANPTVTQTPTAGTLVGEGTTTITVVATDASGNATTRTTSFSVSDTTPPVITWSFTNLVLQTTSDSCQTNMPDVTGTNYIMAYDSCSGTNLVISQSPTNGAALPEGTNWVVLAVADQAGNTNYSTNTIVVVDATLPSATVPSDIVQANDPGQCGAVVTFTLPDQTDNCGVPSQVATPASGSFFDVGTTPVTVVVTDLHGNSSSNSFNVTVNDVQLPVIQSSGNLIQAVDAGKDYATVAFTPAATDNCGLADLTATPPSGSQFPIGTNTVTVVATDVHGNSATSTFTVTVLVPVTIITQPANQTVYTGGMANFGVTASGTPPLTYQWNFNQTSITNATNAVLVLTNVQPNQAGQYSVTVANALNSVPSTNAFLTVNPPPTLSVMQSGNYLLIYWPTDAPGFVLETTAVLSPADWVPVDDSPLQVGNQYLELIPMTGTSQFYRLQLGQ